MKPIQNSTMYSYSILGIDLAQIYNEETVNIFSDASMTYPNRSKTGTGCYGAVVVTRDTIIDSYYRISTNSTNNSCEIRGIRAALIMADKWKSRFSYINIFSDSLISVMGLKEYIYKWKYNPRDRKFHNSNGAIVANQSTFIECHYLLKALEANPNIQIRLFHQNGHISNGYQAIKEAGDHFMKVNHINGVLDLNLIRYISTYNNYVDKTTRGILRRSDKSVQTTEPIFFTANGKINDIL